MITFIAYHFPRVARSIMENGESVTVDVVCEEGDEIIPDVHLDRKTLYVRWSDDGKRIVSFWINREDGLPVLFWPSVEAFGDRMSIAKEMRRTIKAFGMLPGTVL